MDIKILIATHKKYKMPKYKYYLPIHVGKEGKDSIGYIGDNTGENISYKNKYYCELTALYWGWKNLKTDYIGIVHYRRHLSSKSLLNKIFSKKEDLILSDYDIEELVKKYEVILPRKRNYFIENIYDHYANTHYKEHLDITREIIDEYMDEYLISYDKVMKCKKAHMFNMFIMNKKLADEYSEWLFFILSKLELRINIEDYNDFQARLFGRVSEILLNVWIDKNQISYKEIGHIHLEKINWIDKGTKFLKAKYMNKKYEKSF